MSTLFHRRKTWKCLVMLSVGCAAAVGVWMFFFRQEPAVQWIGPRTQDIRDLEAWLDKPIKLTSFDKPTSLKRALERMDELLAPEAEANVVVDNFGFGPPSPWKPLDTGVSFVVDRAAFEEDGYDGDLYELPIDFSRYPQSMSRREFFAAILAQIPSNNGVFHVRRWGWLELTTRTRFRKETTAYFRHNNITIFDRIHHGMSEMWGGSSPLPLPPLLPGRETTLEEPA